MSAFMVEDKTINRVTSTLYHDREAAWTQKQLFETCGIPTDGGRDRCAAQLGQLMFALNIRGVNARYGSDQAKEFRPLDYAYHYEMTTRMQALKSLRCWLYQCTEGDTDQQELYKIMDNYSHSLALSIINELPEYDQADWG